MLVNVLQTENQKRHYYTIFLSWAIVVKRFALAEDLERWIPRDVKSLCKLCFCSSINFSKGNRG